MAYIYMDESGDLGFPANGNLGENGISKYFLITFFIVRQKEDADNIIKKLFHRMSGAKIKIKYGVFHAYKEKPQSIIKMIEFANKKYYKIGVISLNKGCINSKLKSNIHTLYNNTVLDLLKICFEKGILKKSEKVYFIASKRETSKFLNNQFISFLKKNFSNVDFSIQSPHNVKGLQVADTISFSIYQYIENNNKVYYSLIKDKIEIIVNKNPIHNATGHTPEPGV